MQIGPNGEVDFRKHCRALNEPLMQTVHGEPEEDAADYDDVDSRLLPSHLPFSLTVYASKPHDRIIYQAEKDGWNCI